MSLLTREGVFCHRAYARVYLHAQVLKPLSLLHYLFIGERLGHLPNPFFDPAYFKKRSGTRSFLLYLASRSLWPVSTSSRFDPAKFINADGINPLAYYWQHGFDQQLFPAPGFDMGFFQAAVCRDHADKKNFTFELFAKREYDPPVNAVELRKRQTEFRNQIGHRIVRRNAKAAKSHLVFVQAGAQFNADYVRAERDYDILLNFYEQPESNPVEAEWIIIQNGTKTTAINRLMECDPEILLQYDAILFLDDDIVITRAQISELFQKFEEHHLDLAQASLTSTSECFFDCLKQPAAGSHVSALNAIEIMMPLVSQRALRKFGWVFAEGVSGWGVDLLLSAKVRETFGETIALIGSVVVAHERAVDTASGRFYEFLQKNGINANTESGFISYAHHLGDERATIKLLQPRNDVSAKP